MLFQETLRQFPAVPAGVIAFVAAVTAVIPLSGAEIPAGVGESENVVSEGPERWFSVHGLLVGPVRHATPEDRRDCVVDGATTVHAGLAEEAMLDEGCPDYVALDDFEDVDYGGGIGITMCKLDGVEEDSTEYEGSLSGGYKDYVTIGGGVTRTTTRTMCVYYGCDLRISEAAANWSTRN